MSRHALSAFGLLALVGASAPSLAAQKGLPEPRVGLEFKPPKGWVELPADGDRHSTLRLFGSPRALSAAKGEAVHTPLMRVMFFKKGGDDSKDVVDGLPRQTPYRSLLDFSKRGLAAKEASQQPAKAAGIEGQRFTGKVAGDRMLYGHSLPLDDGEVAVCFEVAVEQFEKLKKELDGTLGSLAVMPRTKAERLDPPWVADADWAKKDAASRTAARARWAEELVAATSKAPEIGFKVQKTKQWTVLSAADPAFTKKAITAAEAIRAWIAQKLPDLTKEAPLPAVLRIFENQDNFTAYLTTVTDNREYDQRKRELYFANDRDNGGNGGYGVLFRAVLWQVFDDVDPGVLPAMPRWFDNGCWEFMRSSRFDGKKLEWSASDVEKGRLAYYPQNNLPVPPLWDLMQEHIQTSPADGATEKEWSYTPECARLLRWFFLHDGQKAFGKPSLVCDYVRALGVAYGKLGPDPTIDAAVVGQKESEQKEQNARHYKWRDAMLIQINDIAVPLKVEVWKEVNEKWLEFNKNFK